jgi:predicted transcriptional regulator
MTPNTATLTNQLRASLHEIEHGTEWQTGAPLTWLDRLDTAAAVVEASDRLIRESVEAARAHGATWADIGRVLDCTKQAAQQRFSR